MARADIYQLGYRWQITGPIETAFHYVSRIETWPAWWSPTIIAVQAGEGDVRVGRSARMQVKSFLPYHLDWHVTVTRLEAPQLIEVDCSVTLGQRFPMTGWVRYRLIERGPVVEIINEQEMRSQQPVPALLRPLANAIFNFNHDHAMARGQTGLQRVVDAAVATQVAHSAS